MIKKRGEEQSHRANISLFFGRGKKIEARNQGFTFGIKGGERRRVAYTLSSNQKE